VFLLWRGAREKEPIDVDYAFGDIGASPPPTGHGTAPRP
jgi:hypothetical protein